LEPATVEPVQAHGALSSANGAESRGALGATPSSNISGMKGGRGGSPLGSVTSQSQMNSGGEMKLQLQMAVSRRSAVSQSPPATPRTGKSGASVAGTHKSGSRRGGLEMSPAAVRKR